MARTCSGALHHFGPKIVDFWIPPFAFFAHYNRTLSSLRSLLTRSLPSVVVTHYVRTYSYGRSPTRKARKALFECFHTQNAGKAPNRLS